MNNQSPTQLCGTDMQDGPLLLSWLLAGKTVKFIDGRIYVENSTPNGPFAQVQPTSVTVGHADEDCYAEMQKGHVRVKDDGVEREAKMDLNGFHASGDGVTAKLCSTHLEMNGVQVVGQQRAGIESVPIGGLANAADNATAINAILDALVQHGLIGEA